MAEPNNNDAAAIIEYVRSSETNEALTEADLMCDALIDMPAGRKLVDLYEFRQKRLAAPERRAGVATFTTLESFIAHALRFADVDSAIFANDDPKAPTMTSVLDYHRATAEGAPRFGKHRGHYAFPLSEEWKAWTAIVDRPMSQSDFAAFLEDRIGDVLDPADVGQSISGIAEKLGLALAGPASLLALSRGLSVRVDQKVVSAVNLSTGEVQIGFEEAHRDKDGGGPLKVPGGFAIAIPVFRGGTPYQIGVRLRYRVQGGAVHWRVLMHRAELVFADAFGEACDVARDKTSLPLYRGAPE